jgi:hypothetical protein
MLSDDRKSGDKGDDSLDVCIIGRTIFLTIQWRYSSKLIKVYCVLSPVWEEIRNRFK